MSNVLVEKQKIDILANAISNKSGEPVTMTLDEMVSAVDGIDQGITPTGNIDITSAGVTDVTNYATATVTEGEVFPSFTTRYTTVSGSRKWEYIPKAWIITGDDEGTPGYISNGSTFSGTARTYNAIPTGTTVTPSTSSQTIGGADYMMEGAVTVNAVPTATYYNSVNVAPANIQWNWYVDEDTGSVDATLSGAGTVDDFIQTAGYATTADTFNGSLYANDNYQLPTQSAVTITPTESSQTAVAKGKFTTGAVTVGAISSSYVGSGITRRSAVEDVGFSGATVYVPDGYYGSSGTTTFPVGAEGTPTATKGTVSNHSISVTPSVTNTEGYIEGGTHTGTAVSVSASELVSGSQTITENDTYNVTNLASVVVNVSGGGGGSDVKVDYTDRELASASSSISFSELKGEPTAFCVYCGDSTNLPSGTPYTTIAVVYDGTNLHGQTLTNTSNAQVTYNNSSFSHSYSNGTLTITSSGANFKSAWYYLAYTYDGTSGNIQTADVQVGSGATSITFTNLEDEPVWWSCIFKSNFGTSNGYQRVIFVTDDSYDVTGQYLDSSMHIGASFTASYNNGSFTIASNGTNDGGYFHQPGYYQLTYAISGDQSLQTKTVTPTTSTQNVTADTGYTALKKVVVNPIPSSYVQPTSTVGATTYRASTSNQTINSGTYHSANATIAAVSQTNLSAENIKQGTTISISNGQSNIWSVTGTYSGGGGGGSLTVATKTLTNTATSQTLSFSSLSGQPKYWFLRTTTNVSSSGSTTYYYVTDCFYDGTNIKGNTFRIGSTRRVQNVTSGITQSYSGGTLTITAGSSSGATPGQFYGASNFGYELVYIY